MKKWKKILISLITVFVLAMLPAESAILPGTVCVTEAAPRISSSIRACQRHSGYGCSILD